jgi:hypothetical protein
MPDTKKPERNERIFEAYMLGKTYSEIAEEEGISRVRAQQIVGAAMVRIIQSTRTGDDNPAAEYDRLRKRLQAQHRAAFQARTR